MRKIKLLPGEYYHIYNRGNQKQNIFLDEEDRIRFLFVLLYFQSPVVINNPGYYIRHFIGHRVFYVSPKITNNIIQNHTVELINFAEMPNHFHLILKEIREGGISRYMQKIQDGYTKYFNKKYEKVGHLFQGPFQSVLIKNNEQLLHLSAYIHRNPRELDQWKNNEIKFDWSSYQDYAQKNRWGDLLKTNIILKQFSNLDEYKNFVETSGTKDFLENYEALNLD